MKEKIQASLEKVRPMLQADGGDVHYTAFNPETGELKVELSGVCLHCPMASMTLEQVVLDQVQQDVPEVKSIKLAI